MRIVFVGAGNLTSMTARELIAQGQDVVIIEQSKEKIEELSDELDCGFLHATGAGHMLPRWTRRRRTSCLREGDDRINIIASLIGVSLGSSG
jgi:trk system potassium uptake protein TrkA